MSPVIRCKECGRPLCIDDNYEAGLCRECESTDFVFPCTEELNFDQD